VHSGPALPPEGRCPGCGARWAGGGDTPAAAVEAALGALDVTGIDPDALVRALFSLAPEDPRARRANITSDRREGFYRWWLFVREDPDGAAATLADALR
jgi:hypothetical protein